MASSESKPPPTPESPLLPGPLHPVSDVKPKPPMARRWSYIDNGTDDGPTMVLQVKGLWTPNDNAFYRNFCRFRFATAFLVLTLVRIIDVLHFLLDTLFLAQHTNRGSQNNASMAVVSDVIASSLPFQIVAMTFIELAFFSLMQDALHVVQLSRLITTTARVAALFYNIMPVCCQQCCMCCCAWCFKRKDDDDDNSGRKTIHMSQKLLTFAEVLFWLMLEALPIVRLVCNDRPEVYNAHPNWGDDFENNLMGKPALYLALVMDSAAVVGWIWLVVHTIDSFEDWWSYVKSRGTTISAERKKLLERIKKKEAEMQTDRLDKMLVHCHVKDLPSDTTYPMSKYLAFKFSSEPAGEQFQWFKNTEIEWEDDGDTYFTGMMFSGRLCADKNCQTRGFCPTPDSLWRAFYAILVVLIFLAMRNPKTGGVDVAQGIALSISTGLAIQLLKSVNRSGVVTNIRFNNGTFAIMMVVSILILAAAKIPSRGTDQLCDTILPEYDTTTRVLKPLQDLDKIAGKYPICSQKHYGLSTLDLVYLASNVYACDDCDDILEKRSEYFNPSLKMVLEKDDKILNTQIRVPRTLHFRRFDSKKDQATVIAVRGTAGLWDTLIDVRLWIAIGVIQGFNAGFPLFTLFPDDWISFLVASVTPNSQDPDYDPPHHSMAYALAQLASYIKLLKKEGRQVVLTGHSLGGGVAALASQMAGVKSVTIAAPGTKFASVAFSNPHVRSVNGTLSMEGQPKSKENRDELETMSAVLSIKNAVDPVPMVDKGVGNTAYVLCDHSALACHQARNYQEAIIRGCGDELGRNPNFCDADVK